MVQIKHRITGLYDKKGMNKGWSKKGGAWGSMAQAKTHVMLYKYSPWQLKEYMDCDFIELNENNEVVVTPVSNYLIPKIKEMIIELKRSSLVDSRKDAKKYEELLLNIEWE